MCLELKVPRVLKVKKLIGTFSALRLANFLTLSTLNTLGTFFNISHIDCHQDY